MASLGNSTIYAKKNSYLPFETIPKDWKGGNIPKVILWSNHHPCTKTRQTHYTKKKKKKERKKEKKRKLQASEVRVTQSCLPLCDPMDYTVHRILQARILEWVAFPFCRGSSQPRDQTQISHIAVVFFTSWATREEQLNSTIHKKNHTPWSSEIYSRVTRMAHHKHFKQCYTPH